MSSNEQLIAVFQTRVRDLLERFRQLKQENADLLKTVEKNEQDINDLRAQLAQANNDYTSLKLAKMIEITDGDIESARNRISKLVRDINKCIVILSDEQEQ
jgi:predicted  nucleic acid-binding Zn-ribbon protein